MSKFKLQRGEYVISVKAAAVRGVEILRALNGKSASPEGEADPESAPPANPDDIPAPAVPGAARELHPRFGAPNPNA